MIISIYVFLNLTLGVGVTSTKVLHQNASFTFINSVALLSAHFLKYCLIIVKNAF